MKLLAALRRFACGLRGHDPSLFIEPGRALLRCVTCGHEGAGGWDLSAKPYRFMRFQARLARDRRPAQMERFRTSGGLVWAAQMRIPFTFDGRLFASGSWILGGIELREAVTDAQYREWRRASEIARRTSAA